jgi:DNA-binding NarL/FixJ family response regulator
VAIRVLITDDQMLARHGIRAFLRDAPDIEIVGEASTGLEAVEKAAALSPDVVLMDLTMPGGDGVEATRAIRQRCPRCRVLVVTVHADPELFRRAVEAGAVGYILKDISPSHLASAIRAAYDGKGTIDAGIARTMIDYLQRAGRLSPAGAVRNLYGLTEREVEVLRHLARGLSDKEIASRLYVSESTVKTHLRAIYAKLNLRNRAHAAAFAVEHRLVDTLP